MTLAAEVRGCDDSAVSDYGAHDAPGWHAIDGVFRAAYPAQEPRHWATPPAARALFGGPEALDGISAYEAAHPRPHWHWVTFGLAEFYQKARDDPEWSGYGYELVMRAAPQEVWPGDILRGLANWAHATSTLLGTAQYMDCGEPIVRDGPCVLTGWALIADPVLPGISTPNGRVDFLQVVGLRPEELTYWREHGAQAAVGALSAQFAGDLNTPVRPRLF